MLVFFLSTILINLVCCKWHRTFLPGFVDFCFLQLRLLVQWAISIIQSDLDHHEICLNKLLSMQQLQQPNNGHLNHKHITTAVFDDGSGCYYLIMRVLHTFILILNSTLSSIGSSSNVNLDWTTQKWQHGDQQMLHANAKSADSEQNGYYPLLHTNRTWKQGYVTETRLALTPYISLSLQVSSKNSILNVDIILSCLLGSWLQSPSRVHVSWYLASL